MNDFARRTLASGARLADVLTRAGAAAGRAAAANSVSAAIVLLLFCLVLFLPGLTRIQPMDRDEPRFAQATKQMLETGDFVDIRFQGEARHKKPVGIYWMQAAAVTAGEAILGEGARGKIWLYRLPSLAGAIGAVLLTFWAGLGLTDRIRALAGAALFAMTILIGVEARLAKTDAVVVATVVAAMGVLGRVYRRWREEGAAAPVGNARFAIFWAAIAVGALVKGPITPMVPLLTFLVLALVHRAAGWARALRPLPGLGLALLLIAPWFVLILVKTGGAFLQESVGQDMLGKVAAGQEAHGAPPGTYLLSFWLAAWPLAPFALLAAPVAWRRRREPAVAFLIAWIIPCWLVFEATPTKLPHYVLPLYPAIAILTAMALPDGLAAARGLTRRIAAGLLLLVPAAAPIALLAGAAAFGAPLDFTLFLTAAAAILAALAAAREILAGRQGPALAASALAAVFMTSLGFGQAMGGRWMSPAALSPRLAAMAAEATPGCRPRLYVTAGYREPSLVFLTSTGLLMTDGAGAAAFLAAGPCRIAFVEKREETPALAATGARLVGRVAGINFNGGKKLDIGVHVRQ